jgi:hypothetical protein
MGIVVRRHSPGPAVLPTPQPAFGAALSGAYMMTTSAYSNVEGHKTGLATPFVMNLN